MLGPEMAWLVTQSALRLKEMLRRVTCLVSAAVAELGLVFSTDQPPLILAQEP